MLKIEEGNAYQQSTSIAKPSSSGNAKKVTDGGRNQTIFKLVIGVRIAPVP